MIVDLDALLGPHDAGGVWTDLNGSGVDLSDPTAVDFTGVDTGTYEFLYTIQAGPGCDNNQYSATITAYVNADSVTIAQPSGECTHTLTITSPISGDENECELQIVNDLSYNNTTKMLQNVEVESNCSGFGPFVFSDSLELEGLNFLTGYTTPSRNWANDTFMENIKLQFWNYATQSEEIIDIDTSPLSINTDYLTGCGGTIALSDLYLTNGFSGPEDFADALEILIRNIICEEKPTINLPGNTNVWVDAITLNQGASNSQLLAILIRVQGKHNSNPYSCGVTQANGFCRFDDNGTNFTCNIVENNSAGNRGAGGTYTFDLPDPCDDLTASVQPNNGIVWTDTSNYHNITLETNEQNVTYSNVTDEVTCTATFDLVAASTDCQNIQLYQWYIDGSLVAQGPTMSTIDTTTYGAGDYRCDVVCYTNPPDTCLLVSNVVTVV